MNEEEDFPEIGDTRGGMVLVCHGDDKPEYWLDWLKSLVNEFERLNEIAEERSVDLDAGSDHNPIEDWRALCEAMGISFKSTFWEGSMTSGVYQMGWLAADQIHQAETIGSDILRNIRRNLVERVRSVVISDLKKIKDLDKLIDRTRDDRESLLTQIEELKVSIAVDQKTMSTLEKALAEAKVNDTSALDLDCLHLAGAVLNRERVRLLAGPLVLWDDGVVYAFTSRGGVPLPDDSSPAVLLKQLQRSGHPTVEVGEMTLVGRWIGGPHYRKGTAHISGWANVWREVEQTHERKFLVADPGHLPTVRAIHDHFKTPPISPKESDA